MSDKRSGLFMVDDNSMVHHGFIIEECDHCPAIIIKIAFKGRGLMESTNEFEDVMVHIGECPECGMVNHGLLFVSDLIENGIDITPQTQDETIPHNHKGRGIVH